MYRQAVVGENWESKRRERLAAIATASVFLLGCTQTNASGINWEKEETDLQKKQIKMSSPIILQKTQT